jgi:hypothetical protein
MLKVGKRKEVKKIMNDTNKQTFGKSHYEPKRMNSQGGNPSDIRDNNRGKQNYGQEDSSATDPQRQRPGQQPQGRS